MRDGTAFLVRGAGVRGHGGCGLAPGTLYSVALPKSSSGFGGRPRQASCVAMSAPLWLVGMGKRGTLRSLDGGASPDGTRPRLPVSRPGPGPVSTVGLPPGAGATSGAGNTDPCPRAGAPHGSSSTEPVTDVQLAASAHYPFRHRAAACIAWSFATLEEAAAFTDAIRQCGAELGRPPIPGAATVRNVPAVGTQVGAAKSRQYGVSIPGRGPSPPAPRGPGVLHLRSFGSSPYGLRYAARPRPPGRSHGSTTWSPS